MRALFRFAAIALVALGALALLSVGLPQVWYPMWFDQGAFAACGDVLRRGGVFLRDCWDVRGPLTPALYALATVFSQTQAAVFAFNLAWQAASAVLLGVLARRMFGSASAGVVAGVADRISVLYAGRVCESASAKTIFYNPKHPYTIALLTAVPNLAIKREKLKVIPGTIPNLIEPPSGCRFHPRCEYAQPACSQEVPPLVEIEPEHYVACVRAKEIDVKSPLRAE